MTENYSCNENVLARHRKVRSAFKQSTIFKMRKRIVQVSIAFVLLAALFSDFNKQIWKDPARVIQWDVIDYYGYLPATFIYHDLSLKFTDHYSGEKHFVFWAKKLPNGKRIFKMTMGLSVMYAPFFFVANTVAGPLGYNTGGYSLPYRLALVLAALFYLALGLWVLSKVLRFYFSDCVVAVVILALGLGTNLFWYSTFEPGMSHVYSFFLVSVFIWLTIRWYKKDTIWRSVLLGLVIGLITLVRPVNVFIVLFFVLYDIKNGKDIKKRLQLFIDRYRQVIILAFFGLLIVFPQMIYWKSISGHWIYYSYGNEHFFFLHPHFIDLLFSFRKGWLVYTPVMFFAFWGIYFLFTRLRSWFVPVIVLLLVFLYVASSWWCWWYGGSLGQRELIDIYPFMAVPLAVFVQWVLKQKTLNRNIAGLLFAASVLLGVFYNVQYYYGAIHWDAMSERAYFNSFGRVHPSSKFNHLLIHPDYDRALRGLPEGAGKKVKAETVEMVIQRIKKNKKWLNDVKKKAIERKIPLDSMLKLDARYVLKHKK